MLFELFNVREGNCLVACKWQKALCFVLFRLEWFMLSFNVLRFRAI